MTIEEIRKGAPEGANAYKLLKHRIAYLKRDDNHWWLRTKGGWIKCSLSSHFEEQFLSGEIKPL